ncbi:YqeB family protein [Microlunatus sp. Y2014]|uniref:YqeB family protein n=1 Tax=Microlunatus sp. Y2014 TaxID=3418488 RepID=UPI003DA79708
MTGVEDRRKDHTVDAADQPPAQFRVSEAVRAGIVVVTTVLGTGLGVAAPVVLRWASQLDWLPFQGPRELLAGLAGWAGSWILVALGLVTGLVAGLLIVGSLTTVTVTARDLVFTTGDKVERYARAQVTEVVLDGKHLVLRDERDADLVRHDLDVEPQPVLDAIRERRWPVR